jgi:hypothetical protein
METSLETAQALDLATIEACMLEQEGQIEIPVDHIFSGGVYIRQIMVPAGTLIMGKRHRKETCNILLKGVLQIYVDENKPPITIRGPHLFTSPPGTKKFAYCVEDAVYINIHPTTETNLEVIEREFIIPEQEYLAQKEESKWLGSE